MLAHTWQSRAQENTLASLCCEESFHSWWDLLNLVQFQFITIIYISCKPWMTFNNYVRSNNLYSVSHIYWPFTTPYTVKTSLINSSKAFAHLVQVYGGPASAITPTVQDNVNLCIDLGQKIRIHSPIGNVWNRSSHKWYHIMSRCYIHAL